MRFIQGFSHETTQLLQRIDQHSEHHRVRQRAHGVLRSFQGDTPKELAPIFHVDRSTISHWFDAGETRRFPGLYDRKGQGRLPRFTPEPKDEMRQWAKLFPKNRNNIGACIRDQCGLDVSQQTIKRVLKSFAVSWRRSRKTVQQRPDPETDQEKREALATRIAEDREGIIALRYCDASGFC